MQLTREQEELLPSEADVQFYEEHGWYISGKILPDEVIDAAVRGSHRHYAGERDAQLPIQSGYSDWKPEHGAGLRNSEFVALQNREIRQLVEYQLIGAIAARLSRSRTVRLFYDQLVCKPTFTEDEPAVIGWHTDRAYWMTCTSENMLTAWVPFHDCDQCMGTLMVLDGSHRWSGTTGLRTFKESNLAELERRFSGGRQQYTKVPVVLKKGQVSFHHCLTIHGSDVNRGTSPRLSLAIHLQDESNRHRVYRNERGIPWHIVNDRLCRVTADGTPDYTDPNAFPVLWDEAR
jgi:hypothetical protein